MATTNSYYTHSSGQPTQISRGSSAAVRAEFDAIAAAFTLIEQQVSAASAASDFKLIYQGSRTTDPTSRYNNTQLQDGDLYFNSTDKVMKSFYGGQWYSVETAASAMPRSGGAFTGPVSGTSAEFTSTVKAAGFIGNGSQLTNLATLAVVSAIGYTPVNKGGDTMLGPLNGTTMSMSGSITGADFIMSSDERRKMKWEPLPDAVLDDFAAIKKIGTYFDKKDKVRKAGAGAQSMANVLALFARELEDGTLGIDYGPAALVLLHKAMKRIQKLEKRLAQLEK